MFIIIIYSLCLLVAHRDEIFRVFRKIDEPALAEKGKKGGVYFSI